MGSCLSSCTGDQSGNIEHAPPSENNYYTAPQVQARRVPVDQTIYTITAPRSQIGPAGNPVASLSNRRVDLRYPVALNVSANRISPEVRHDHTYSFTHHAPELFEAFRRSVREIKKRTWSGEHFIAASGSVDVSLEKRLRGLYKDDSFSEDCLNNDEDYVELHIRQLMLDSDLTISGNKLFSEDDMHQLFDRYSALRGSSIRRPLPNIMLPVRQLSQKRTILDVEQENLVRRLENLNYPIVISGFMPFRLIQSIK